MSQVFLRLKIIFRKLHLGLVKNLGPDSGLITSVIYGWICLIIWLAYLSAPIIFSGSLMVLASENIMIIGDLALSIIIMISTLFFIICCAWIFRQMQSDLCGFRGRNPREWVNRVSKLEQLIKNLERNRA
ncbi:hypothetical protein ROA7450_02314 [Roseovarius albus]|uniref:Uncharacterized protein n=1 Tax=Roseovarius albus TaxID=1247867 RepID=A0A1X6ZBN1_9RHOB|nr:hypothetical protein ROA7450_02314 [Roseovarius albus]